MALRIVTDSTAALPPEEVARHGIAVAPLSVTLQGVTQTDDEVDAEAFYRRMLESGEFPTSSQPSVATLIESFERPAERGDAVVGVFISSGMSGTFQTAEMAREQVLERHPGAVIELVDSRSNSMEEGFAVLAAAEVAERGGTAREAVAAAHRTIARTRWLFTPATLDYLRMGGRIGSARALLGSLLQIRPILTVVDGVTASMKSVRTQRRALEEIAEMTAADFDEYGYSRAVVHHVIAEAEAASLADAIEERSGHRPSIALLPASVGLHVGPGSLGVVYETVDELHKNTVES